MSSPVMETAQESALPDGAVPVLEEPSPVDPHQVPVAESDNERTILDYLNEDCWREMLGYLTLREIIQTESVSKQWQIMVLQYLSYINFGIEQPFFGRKHPHTFLVSLKTAEKVSSFTSWTSKLGPAVKRLHWQSEEGLDIIRDNCPNLEVLRLSVSPKLKALSSEQKHFNCLQQLCAYYCGDISDECLSQLIAGNALEELKVLCNRSISGECLQSLNSGTLKSLVFKRCQGLGRAPLLSAADRLGALTKLVLKWVPVEIGTCAHLLLDKTPKLEYLHIHIVNPGRSVPVDSNVFYEAVCSLSSLEYLHVNYKATDKHMEAVACCCGKLQRLLLRRCREVTGRGLEAVCRLAGARLTALGVCCSRRVTDDDIVACVRACPNLTWLVLDGCTELSPYGVRSTLAERVAAERRAMRPASVLQLKLDADFWSDNHQGVLEITTSEPSYDSDWVHERNYIMPRKL